MGITVGDISDTALGEAIIRDIAKPAFRSAIDLASEKTGFEPGIDLDNGDWAVVPVGEVDLS